MTQRNKIHFKVISAIIVSGIVITMSAIYQTFYEWSLFIGLACMSICALAVLSVIFNFIYLVIFNKIAEMTGSKERMTKLWIDKIL